MSVRFPPSLLLLHERAFLGTDEAFFFLLLRNRSICAFFLLTPPNWVLLAHLTAFFRNVPLFLFFFDEAARVPINPC